MTRSELREALQRRVPHPRPTMTPRTMATPLLLALALLPSGVLCAGDAAQGDWGESKWCGARWPAPLQFEVAVAVFSWGPCAGSTA